MGWYKKNQDKDHIIINPSRQELINMVKSDTFSMARGLLFNNYLYACPSSELTHGHIAEIQKVPYRSSISLYFKLANKNAIVLSCMFTDSSFSDCSGVYNIPVIKALGFDPNTGKLQIEPEVGQSEQENYQNKNKYQVPNMSGA